MTITPEQVQERVLMTLTTMGLDTSAVTRETVLTAMDIDSLDVVEVGHVMRKEFGVELKGEDVQGVRTVGDLVDAFVARAAAMV